MAEIMQRQADLDRAEQPGHHLVAGRPGDLGRLLVEREQRRVQALDLAHALPAELAGQLHQPGLEQPGQAEPLAADEADADQQRHAEAAHHLVGHLAAAEQMQQQQQAADGEDDLRQHLHGQVADRAGGGLDQRDAAPAQQRHRCELAADLGHRQQVVHPLPNPAQDDEIRQGRARHGPAGDRAPAERGEQHLDQMEGHHDQDAPAGLVQQIEHMAEPEPGQQPDRQTRAERAADQGEKLHSRRIQSPGLAPGARALAVPPWFGQERGRVAFL